jgi:hypothetical protein
MNQSKFGKRKNISQRKKSRKEDGEQKAYGGHKNILWEVS